jgi:hypothetical protein
VKLREERHGKWDRISGFYGKTCHFLSVVDTGHSSGAFQNSKYDLFFISDFTSALYV